MEEVEYMLPDYFKKMNVATKNKNITMEWPQTYFEILYKLIREQNLILFKEISIRENISYTDLQKQFLPSKKFLKNFIHMHNDIKLLDQDDQ
jgi:hypothetical protein